MYSKIGFFFLSFPHKGFISGIMAIISIKAESVAF